MARLDYTQLCNNVTVHTEKQFQDLLSTIKLQSWYINNQLLKNYLESEWLSCTQVSMVTHSKSLLSLTDFDYIIILQLWAHAYRQHFHSGIDTNNLTESFNNVLRRRYLPLRHDTTIHALVQILIEVAFPEQETRYVQATIKRTGAYRKPRYDIPYFLKDRPESVQSLCLLNIQRGISIPKSYITQQDPVSSGKFKLKKTNSDSEGDDQWEVDVCSGTCTCPSFISAHVSCKHMFAIFHHYTQWS